VNPVLRQLLAGTVASESGERFTTLSRSTVRGRMFTEYPWTCKECYQSLGHIDLTYLVGRVTRVCSCGCRNILDIEP
jgi:hypothetical protein